MAKDVEGLDLGSQGEARTAVAKSFSKATRIPVYAALEMFDLVEKLKQHRFEMTTEEDLKIVVSAMSGGIMRWRIRQMNHEDRRKVMHGAESVLENYIESTVEGILSKGKKVRVNAVAKQVEFYKKIPKAVVLPTVRRVVHRMRVKMTRFASDESAKRIFRRHGIPVQDFQEMLRAGVIGPRTGEEALEVLGRALYHHYNVTKRLKVT